ncbi:hypothetical protein CPB85DRAFT_1551029 [Mucidula mucida]|nr:hypothetical protein CPB85DRAFT_1551029 [Mucidula mucida]
MSPTSIPIVNWSRPEPTKYALDYADLTDIDLSLYDQPGGRETLVKTIRHALTEVNHQFALGQTFFEQSLEEKNSNRCNFDEGGYFGYRAAFERTVYGTEVKDNMELINIPKDTNAYDNEPRHRLIQENKEVIGAFKFTRPLLVQCCAQALCPLCSVLELPENYFVDLHHYEQPSEDHLRYIMYHSRTKEQDAKCQNLWSWAHTDYGSLTLLFSQNVSGLQIKTPAGEYRDIQPADGSIVVNVADTLSFMTKSYLKSTIHRVRRPPPDQDHINRVGLIYMCRPVNDSLIRPAPSPLLRRLGLLTPEDEADQTEVTALEYLKARVKRVHAGMTYGASVGEKFKHKNLKIVENHAQKTDKIDALSPISASA